MATKGWRGTFPEEDPFKKTGFTYKVDLIFVHEDSHGDQEGEEQFVFLKQTPADVRV